MQQLRELDPMMLTKTDIDELVRQPSATMRGKIVKKVCSGFNEGSFSSTERTLAVEIFRLLLRDTQKQIRKLMALELKDNIHVPHDVVWSLANDDTDIATIMLENSFVLTEEDLISIIQATHEVPRLKSIAKRSTLSENVTHELFKAGVEEVAKTTLENSGAKVTERSLNYVLEHYREDQSILDALVTYGNLPHSFAEKLFTLVSEQLQEQLTKRYRLSLRLADKTTRVAKDAATLQFLSPWMSQQDLNRLVNRMQRNKRLDVSVVMRSLCIGDLRFFETAIAKMVSLPVGNVRMLLNDPGPHGFGALYAQTDMPEDFAEAIQTVYAAAMEETDGGKYRYEDYGLRIRQRLIAQGKDSIQNMNTLFSLLRSEEEGDGKLH